MVVFTCLNCGDSLQKPRVEKHYNTACRKPISLSCVDCFKDFHGDAYIVHTKCITEDERYAAKGYQAKPNANKGLQKQEKWIETVQAILNDNPNLPNDQRQILNIIVKHDNIPRKKPKFLNFLKSVCPRANHNAAGAVFDLLENEHKKNNPPKHNANGSPQKSVENGNASTNGSSNGNLITNGSLNGNPITNGSSNENNTLNSSNISNGKSKKSNEERFKWKPTILHFVSKKQSIKKKKLMKKVLQAYKLYHPELSDIPETVVKKYHIKLSKMKKVIVDDDLVKLK